MDHFLPAGMGDVFAIAGVATGVTSLVVSTLNYRRDRARVKLDASFNMAPAGTMTWQTIVTVTNLGRRPVHVSHVALLNTRFGRFGRRDKAPYLITWSVKGETLAEGSKPWSLLVNQDAKFINMVRRTGYVVIAAHVGDRVVYSRPKKAPTPLEEFDQ